MEAFVIAVNPDPASKLPNLLRVPLGRSHLVLKAQDRWPRTAAVYCHRAEEWPESSEVLAAVQVRYPSVPIVFCETRPLTEEWAYRWLGAALIYAQADSEHAT